MSLEKKPLSDEVFHVIRELIETGEMPSGSKISEPSLAKNYRLVVGLSVTPLPN
jgi:DNA-binding GntR family transcriptional regulator